jgi:hypothetical protein
MSADLEAYKVAMKQWTTALASLVEARRRIKALEAALGDAMRLLRAGFEREDQPIHAEVIDRCEAVLDPRARKVKGRTKRAK